jgi:outer membrane protein OmpA-like peptidoglycan-associated protein
MRLAYPGREQELEALRESAERRFARTNPGGVIEGAESVELNNYLVDGSAPRAEHQSAIRRNALRLAQMAFTDPTFAIEIVGHASSSGSPTKNQLLSRQRANQAAQIFFAAVRAELLSKGFPLPSIETALSLRRGARAFAAPARVSRQSLPRRRRPTSPAIAGSRSS